MITVKITNDELSGKLKEIHEKGSDLRPVLRMVSEDMLDAVHENFETEGHGKWKPLAKSTQRQKQKKGYSHKILKRSGQLESSVQNNADDTRAIVGTNLAYAAIQQLGGEINVPAKPLLFRRYSRGQHKGRTLFARSDKAHFGMMSKPYKVYIPPRPFLALTDENIQGMIKRVGDYIYGG